jgi:hypothetical protein
MKNLILIVCLVFTTVALPSAAMAGDGHGHAKGKHAHRAPHGGNVETVGKFHVELVRKDGQIQVYVLDAKEETVEPPQKAKLTLIVGKHRHELALAKDGDHLAASLPGDGRAHLDEAQGKASVLLSVVLDGKPRTVRFKLTGHGHKAHEQEGHEHKGHGEKAHEHKGHKHKGHKHKGHKHKGHKEKAHEHKAHEH